MFNEEVWAEFASVRRELKALKAQVQRLEAADLERFLFRQRLHDVTRCASCGEKHECAVVSGGIKSTNGELVALCESCWTRNREQAVTA